ncbi:MAG: sulfur carrier protein ThiS [Hyphomicrobiales bacterium]|nr:sulfur carrier protein ThiS [Hyphomicrobiales bacterium]
MTGADAPTRIRLNGSEQCVRAATLADLLSEQALDSAQRGIAVAVNGAVVPRAAWAQTQLQAGDDVEIVRARQGG